MKILPDKIASSGRNHNVIWATDDEFAILQSLVRKALQYTPKVTETYKVCQHLREMSRKFNNPKKNG